MPISSFLLLLLFATTPVVGAQSWELTWEDDFLGSALNMTHGDKELQLYMAEQVSVRDGTLVLTTVKKPAMYGAKEYQFVSGWVDTQSKISQTFGKIDVRAQLPNPDAQGIWPAHWLMPEKNAWNCWPVGGEIDIMEATGGEQNNPGTAPTTGDTTPPPLGVLWEVLQDARQVAGATRALGTTESLKQF